VSVVAPNRTRSRVPYDAALARTASGVKKVLFDDWRSDEFLSKLPRFFDLSNECGGGVQRHTFAQYY